MRWRWNYSARTKHAQGLNLLRYAARSAQAMIPTGVLSRQLLVMLIALTRYLSINLVRPSNLIPIITDATCRNGTVIMPKRLVAKELVEHVDTLIAIVGAGRQNVLTTIHVSAHQAIALQMANVWMPRIQHATNILAGTVTLVAVIHGSTLVLKISMRHV